VSSNKSKLLAAAALVITFLAGALVGVIFERVMTMRRGGAPRIPPTAFIVHRLDARLHLSDQQRAQVTEIVQRHEDNVRRIWSGMRPAVRNEIENANSEIDSVLTPEQRATFAKLKMRLIQHR